MGNVSCNYTLPCIPPVGHHPPPHTTAYSLPLHDEIKTLESMVTQLTEQNRDALEVLHRQAEEVSELRRSLEDFRLNDSVGTEARAASEARAGSFTSSARRSDNSSHRHRHQPSSSLSSSSPLVADATVLRGDYYGEQQRMKPNEDEDMHNVTFDNDENNMTAGAVSGDTTLQATERAVQEVAAEEDVDDRIVIVVSDGNLGRYAITPEELEGAMTADPRVQTYIIFIAEAGAAEWLVAQLPLQQGYVCMDLEALPSVVKDIFAHAAARDE